MRSQHVDMVNNVGQPNASVGASTDEGFMLPKLTLPTAVESKQTSLPRKGCQATVQNETCPNRTPSGERILHGGFRFSVIPIACYPFLNAFLIRASRIQKSAGTSDFGVTNLQVITVQIRIDDVRDTRVYLPVLLRQCPQRRPCSSGSWSVG